MLSSWVDPTTRIGGRGSVGPASGCSQACHHPLLLKRRQHLPFEASQRTHRAACLRRALALKEAAGRRRARLFTSQPEPPCFRHRCPPLEYLRLARSLQAALCQHRTTASHYSRLSASWLAGDANAAPRPSVPPPRDAWVPPRGFNGPTCLKFDRAGSLGLMQRVGLGLKS